MRLALKLPDGTRAGIAPVGDLRDVSLRQLGLECLAPADDVPVVFYVSDQSALDRIRTRFGLARC